MHIQLPMGINTEAWDEWLEFRRLDKKSKVGPVAAKKQFKLLLKYTEEDQQKIIDTSINGGWAGLFELKGQSNGQHQQASKQSITERAAEQARFIHAQCAAEEAGFGNDRQDDPAISSQMDIIGGRDDQGREVFRELPFMVPEDRTLN